MRADVLGVDAPSPCLSEFEAYLDKADDQASRQNQVEFGQRK
jgi:hypothetical protein